jgi:hypothetical protein
MAVQIGKLYLENLSRIKTHIADTDFGAWHENPQMLRENGKGYCYYDRCPIKNTPEEIGNLFAADMFVKVEFDSGTEQYYFFHEACLNYLLHKDPRVPLKN